MIRYIGNMVVSAWNARSASFDALTQGLGRSEVLQRERERERRGRAPVHRRSLVASAIALLGALCIVALIGCPDTSNNGGASARYTCSNGTPQTGSPAGSADVENCARCDNGYKLSDNRCATRTAYTCANGTPAVGIPNGNEDVEICIMCDDGYHHEGNACVINSYLCPNGTPFDKGATGGTHGTEYCEACDDDYYLTRTGDRCSNLGAAFRVGTATRFGQNVNAVGLAAIDSTLYMSATISTHTAALYTVDITAGSTTLGEATRVGADTNGDGTIDYPDFFGVDERNPVDLAAIGNTLYMLGDGTNSLYTVDTTTGAATIMGIKGSIGEDDKLPTGLAALNGTLYMVGAENGALFTVDVNEGEGTRVGVSEFGDTIGEREPRGLAAINGVLYMVGRSNPFFRIGDLNSALYTVATAVEKEGDEVTREIGEARQVGSARNFVTNGNRQAGLPSGLAAVVTGSTTTLYMTKSDNNLYRLVYE